MARLYPSDIAGSELTGVKSRELTTLKLLASELPDDYSVFHSVHWSRISKERKSHGEVDFVVVNRSGDVLIIEQKDGSLEETPEGLRKHYADGPKLVTSQITRNIWNLSDRFKCQAGMDEKLSIDYLIYCPGHHVRNITGPGIDMSRTIDAKSKMDLPKRVMELLSPGVERADNWADIVCAFFAQSFHVVPDVSSYVDSQKQVYTHLVEGLSEAIAKIDFSPFRLRVIGSAGCGKSQLTLGYCSQKLARGRRPLLLCFNRPLADRLGSLAPEGTRVDTYYGFCKKTLEALTDGVSIRPTQDSKFWRDVQDQLVGVEIPESEQFDTLVVDEGQDFKQEWWEILQLFLTEDASVLWLEDPMQNLRKSEVLNLGDGFVTYKEDSNFRTPRSIGDVIRRVLDVHFSQRNELPGLGLHIEKYENPPDQKKIVAHRVNELRKAGFSNDEIVIVSCRGLKHATFASWDTVGGLPVRRFTGQYTDDGQQIYTDGRLFLETIQRFKGQQAPAVILMDIDETLGASDHAKRVLYCGMTRATVRLEMLVQERNHWLTALECAA